MDFAFTEQEERFRREVRDFTDREIKPYYDNPPLNGTHEYEEWHSDLIKRIALKLGARGWLSLGWPREYGGRPITYIEQLIFKEEMGYYENWGISRQAVLMAGPTVLRHGTEAQKRELIPPIARGEVWWSQGYSEPGAGSDLANLQTKAVLEGDYFRVNGQKIWSSNAAIADRYFFLARTNPDAPKHRGISFLVTDMRAPGITVRPITQMHGGSDDFTEVFFDNVLVPKENLIGELNQGWYVAMGQLSGERSQIDFLSTLKRRMDDLTQYVKDVSALKRDTRQWALTRNRLADVYVEFNVARLINYRLAWMQAAGQDASAAASMCKGAVGPVCQRFAATAIRILGQYGQLGRYGEDAKWAPAHGRLMLYYLRAVSRTIGAGTHEIQLNIIATRGLGLPQG